MCTHIFTVGFLECCISHQPVQHTWSSSSVWLRCCSLNFPHPRPQNPTIWAMWLLVYIQTTRLYADMCLWVKAELIYLFCLNVHSPIHQINAEWKSRLNIQCFSNTKQHYYIKLASHLHLFFFVFPALRERRKADGVWRSRANAAL